MNMKKSVFVLFSLCLALSCDASVWPAVWIGCHAEKSGADLRVAYFRKSAQLNTVPDAHLIRVSADNRYKLFVNGVLVFWDRRAAISATGITKRWISHPTFAKGKTPWQP